MHLFFEANEHDTCTRSKTSCCLPKAANNPKAVVQYDWKPSRQVASCPVARLVFRRDTRGVRMVDKELVLTSILEDVVRKRPAIQYTRVVAKTTGCRAVQIL